MRSQRGSSRNSQASQHRQCVKSASVKSTVEPECASPGRVEEPTQSFYRLISPARREDDTASYGNHGLHVSSEPFYGTGDRVTKRPSKRTTRTRVLSNAGGEPLRNGTLPMTLPPRWAVGMEAPRGWAARWGNDASLPRNGLSILGSTGMGQPVDGSF